MNHEAAYRELIDRFKDVRLLESIGALVGWDQHTYMPPKGVNHRAEQMGYLAKLGHEKLTTPRIGELLGSLEGLAETAEAVKSLALVGISWSKDPDAIIEDKAHQRTFFVKRGQMVGDNIKVEAVFKDHVVLSLDGQEFELR